MNLKQLPPDRAKLIAAVVMLALTAILILGYFLRSPGSVRDADPDIDAKQQAILEKIAQDAPPEVAAPATPNPTGRGPKSVK